MSHNYRDFYKTNLCFYCFYWWYYVFHITIRVSLWLVCCLYIHKSNPCKISITANVRNIDLRSFKFGQLSFVFFIVRTIKVQSFNHVCDFHYLAFFIYGKFYITTTYNFNISYPYPFIPLTITTPSFIPSYLLLVLPYPVSIT